MNGVEEMPVIGNPISPRRVQLSRRKGWRMPENTVKVDRSTKFGNHHDWRDWREQWPFPSPYMPEAEISRDDWCRAMAVQAFEEDIRDGVIVLPIDDLVGKNLACWCKLGGHPKSCHADVLLELAIARASQETERG